MNDKKLWKEIAQHAENIKDLAEEIYKNYIMFIDYDMYSLHVENERLKEKLNKALGG